MGLNPGYPGVSSNRNPGHADPLRARYGLACPGTASHHTTRSVTVPASDRRSDGTIWRTPPPGGTCRHPLQRTLNPRARWPWSL